MSMSHAVDCLYAVLSTVLATAIIIGLLHFLWTDIKRDRNPEEPEWEYGPEEGM